MHDFSETQRDSITQHIYLRVSLYARQMKNPIRCHSSGQEKYYYFKLRNYFGVISL